MMAAVALDLGTTSIKAGLLDSNGSLHNIISRPAPEIKTEGGRCESDAAAYAAIAEQVLTECLSNTSAKPPLGMCSQRSSFLIWERASGKPVTPLISWQDTRGAPSCGELANHEALIREQTGLRLTPYYFAPKLRVVLREHPEWRAPLERGEFMAGTLNTFLIWRWTNGTQHVTDASMAARTLLMDTRSGQWSPQLCALFDIPQTLLPRILPSTDMNLELANGLTLQASIGDQSAALVASISGSSEVLVNLGTGGFVIRYLPAPPPPCRGRAGEGVEAMRTHASVLISQPLRDAEHLQPGYLRTLVYRDERAHFAAEGTLNSLAAALAPYPVSECQLEDLGTDNIFCLAEPGGIGAPWFRKDLGLTFSEPVAHLPPRHIAALLLEGIIFRVARILEDFHRAAPLARVYLSGGLSELPALRQGIAQCAPCAVYRLQQKESSLQGAALLAAGLPPGGRREAEKTEAMHPALTEKYRRWGNWLDGLLSA